MQKKQLRQREYVDNDLENKTKSDNLCKIPKQRVHGSCELLAFG